jgi:hypothetical protein
LSQTGGSSEKDVRASVGRHEFYRRAVNLSCSTGRKTDSYRAILYQWQANVKCRWHPDLIARRYGDRTRRPLLALSRILRGARGAFT